MSIVKGNSGNVKSGANAVNEITDWGYDEKDNVITKPHAVGDTAEEYAAEGVKGGSGTFNAVYDPADATGQATLTPGASVVLTLNDDSLETVGSTYLSGTVVISSVGKKSAAGEFISRSYGFSGVLTEATY